MSSGRELLDRVQEAYRNGQYTEALFSEAFCHILEANNVEYKTEHTIQTNAEDGAERRCGIYIPETDMEIELNLNANLRGVGQCVYYARYCREAILISDGDPIDEGHNEAVRKAAEVAPGVKYALCIPGVAEDPAVMDLITDDVAEFFHQAAYGAVGDRDFALIKSLGRPGSYSGVGAATGENPVNHWAEQSSDAGSSLGDFE